MFGNLGFTEILMLMVVFLLVFGAKRLPEIGSAMGKGIREFKRSMKEVQDEIDRPPPPPEPRRLANPEDRDRLA
jgi:sec-independent protein translocase protein TatA